MSGETLFISDCHLDSTRPEITQALAGFLRERATDASALYILGDLFEAWLGDDDDAEEHGAVIDALSELSKGCDLSFMAGNRDFLLGEDFASRVGLTRLTEPHCIKLGDVRVALVHGDSLCTDDHDYQAFRSMVRRSEWQDEFLGKPLTERREIAAQLRRNSVAAMSMKASDIMDVNESTVAELFRQTACDVILHGHTHRPAIHEYEAGRQRIVLGDWIHEPSYVSWTRADGFRLVDPRVNDA